MSYILEALKKAQAERQLGSAPTIHATPFPDGAGADRSPTARRALPLALGLGALIVAGALWYVFAVAPAGKGAAPESPHAASPAVAGTADNSGMARDAGAAATVPGAAAGSTAAGVPDGAGLQRPAPTANGAPALAPLATAQPPLRTPGMAAASPGGQAQTATAQARDAGQIAPPTPAPAADAAPRLAASGDETLPLLHDLPDAVQRSVPRIEVGGYIYSNNPADRLLLIDKVLRHEGEEVAPGLTLEKLLPKAAVMNYKGNRFRVAY